MSSFPTPNSAGVSPFQGTPSVFAAAAAIGAPAEVLSITGRGILTTLNLRANNNGSTSVVLVVDGRTLTSIDALSATGNVTQAGYAVNFEFYQSLRILAGAASATGHVTATYIVK